MQNRNPRLIEDRTIEDSQTGAGPANYQAASRPTLTFNNLREIDSINDVEMSIDNAVWTPRPVSVSRNVLTYLLVRGTAGACSEVANGTNTSGANIRATAIGQAR